MDTSINRNSTSMARLTTATRAAADEGDGTDSSSSKNCRADALRAAADRRRGGENRPSTLRRRGGGSSARGSQPPRGAARGAPRRSTAATQTTRPLQLMRGSIPNPTTASLRLEDPRARAGAVRVSPPSDEQEPLPPPPRSGDAERKKTAPRADVGGGVTLHAALGSTPRVEDGGESPGPPRRHEPPSTDDNALDEELLSATATRSEVRGATASNQSPRSALLVSRAQEAATPRGIEGDEKNASQDSPQRVPSAAATPRCADNEAAATASLSRRGANGEDEVQVHHDRSPHAAVAVALEEPLKGDPARRRDGGVPDAAMSAAVAAARRRHARLGGDWRTRDGAIEAPRAPGLDSVEACSGLGGADASSSSSSRSSDIADEGALDDDRDGSAAASGRCCSGAGNPVFGTTPKV